MLSPPAPCRRRLARCAALVTVALAASVPAVAVVARGSAGSSDGYVRLLIATDRQGDARAIARKAERLGGLPIRLLPGPHLLAVRVPRRDAPLLRRRLAETRGVRFVERNQIITRIAFTGTAEAIPSDPLWPKQRGLVRIGVPEAWAVTKGSPSVVIAVLDTGVDFSQPDLQGAFVPGYDAVDGGNDPSDDNGHGTRTAGIVGARADNGIGISGVCPQCSVMPVKVVGPNGMATALELASGITWATDHGAAILSLSLGGSQSDAVSAAVRYAEEKGVLVVAAAGNNGSSQPFYPAADPGVLSVAATRQNDKLYSWSNHGRWVAVAAPGCDITTFKGGRYGSFCGTSASTPVVAGLAGLALSYSPTSSAQEIEQAIVSSAHSVRGVADGSVDAVGTLAALGATFESVPARLRALRARWHIRLALRGGRVAATLRSPKARSCFLSLHSADAVWRSSRRAWNADSLVARVAAGTYRLDVLCRLSRPRPASLTVRTLAPRLRHA